MNEDELLAALKSCRIAHHIPGRLRVKLGTHASRALPGKAEAMWLLDRLRRLDGVKAVSLNALARSCTVEYLPSLISPAAWEDLLAGNESQSASALLERFALGEGEQG